MPRGSELRALEHLHQQLTQVLERKDWNALPKVDEAIRTCLQLLAQLPSLSDEVLAAKQRLKQLHFQARVDCSEECERLRVLLLKHLESSEGRNAYLQVEMYQGGT